MLRLDLKNYIPLREQNPKRRLKRICRLRGKHLPQQSIALRPHSEDARRINGCHKLFKKQGRRRYGSAKTKKENQTLKQQQVCLGGVAKNEAKSKGNNADD
jgi:hypothetical protein